MTDMPTSYLVRIYRRGDAGHMRMTGIVHAITDGTEVPFNSAHELLQLLNAGETQAIPGTAVRINAGERENG